MMEREEVMKRLNLIFQEIFNDENIIVTADTCADDVEGWDSLRHITLISVVEKTFGLKFTMKEVLNMENVGSMADIVVLRATK